MLIEPASNVSVPPTVVMRICVSVPPAVPIPPDQFVCATLFWPIIAVETHVFPEKFVSVIAPLYAAAAPEPPPAGEPTRYKPTVVVTLATPDVAPEFELLYVAPVKPPE